MMGVMPERVYFKHGAYYYVTLERVWLRLGSTEAEALAAHARIIASPERLTTMGALFDKYTAENIPKKAERTQKDNLKEIANLRAVFGAMRPQDVKPKHISQYLALRTAKVRANREIALLSHIFNRALNWGVLENNPCRGIDRNEEFPRDRYVTDAEVAAFKAYCPAWLQVWLDFKYLTGLRQGDMFKLSWANVSARGIELRIAKSGRGNSQRGASRVIFMLTAELSKILARAKVLAGEEKNIFVSPTKRAITTSLFSNAWRQVWERVRKDGNDLEYFREHDIRAKTATDAEEFGQDATALLTHADKKTTAAYLRGRASKKITPLR